MDAFFETLKDAPVDLLIHWSPHYAPRNSATLSSVIVHSFGLSLIDFFTLLDEKGLSVHYIIPQCSGAELLDSMATFSSLTEPFFQTRDHTPYTLLELRHPEKTPIILCVPPEYAAFHAGKSAFGSLQGFNDHSIGIEIQAPGYDDAQAIFTPYSPGQQETAILLLEALFSSQNIPPDCLLAHSSIAPLRKNDPGPLFFWQELQEQGFGYLPPSDPSCLPTDLVEIPPHELQQALEKIGFVIPPGTPLEPVLQAFVLQFSANHWPLSWAVDETSCVEYLPADLWQKIQDFEALSISSSAVFF